MFKNKHMAICIRKYEIIFDTAHFGFTEYYKFGIQIYSLWRETFWFVTILPAESCQLAHRAFYNYNSFARFLVSEKWFNVSEVHNPIQHRLFQLFLLLTQIWNFWWVLIKQGGDSCKFSCCVILIYIYI